MSSSTSSNTGLSTPSTTTPSPPRVLKRKAATENDIFKPAKRAKSTLDQSAFALGYQKEQQKVRNELNMVPDTLKGIIIPPNFMPIPKVNPYSKIVSFDDTRTRQWAQMNSHKDRVRKHKHVSEARRDTALATFPKKEAAKKEEAKAKAQKKGDQVQGYIDHYRKRIDAHGKDNPKGKTADPEKGKANPDKDNFMHQCWKCLNYAAKFKPGNLEHEDFPRWNTEFARKWTQSNNKFWRPVWTKGKKRGSLVMEWDFRRM